jgi:hypothetical protein
LPAAAIEIQILNSCALRLAVSAWQLMVHAAMHATVLKYLRRRTMWAIVVVLDLKRHRTGLQGQIQPDSRKQAQGASAPGLLLLSDPGQVTQVLVSTRISRLSLNPCTEAICKCPCSSSARITTVRK